MRVHPLAACLRPDGSGGITCGKPPCGALTDAEGETQMRMDAAIGFYTQSTKVCRRATS